MPKIIYSKNIYADRLCSKVENNRNIHQILILNLILSVLIMNIMKILVDSNFGWTFIVLQLLGFPNLWSLAIQYKWIKLLSSTIVVIYFLQSKIYVLQLVFWFPSLKADLNSNYCNWLILLLKKMKHYYFE